MCNQDFHHYFIKIDQSYCLYCDKFLSHPEYKIRKNKDMRFNCNNDIDIIMHDNAIYCKNVVD